ncbi:hypothetical protein [Halobacteriovorax sp. JY17]|uniref:hypothetical protein n=1 Tax=Halobacteriovorax sp. JY17 TaxID=2014617 RepID=UPI000C36139E|nr:hypothetical protein [Halobacteriovorax sp. JY17]PIK14816.1 MAG: hypothetical protein CES88_10800 [Halobacteriovorax sp. JY17]
MENVDNPNSLKISKRKLRGRELFATLPNSSLEEGLSKTANESLVKESAISVQEETIEGLSSDISQLEEIREKELAYSMKLKNKIQENKEQIEILQFKFDKIKESYINLEKVNQDYQKELIVLEATRSKKESSLRLLENQHKDLSASIISLRNRKRKITDEKNNISLKLVKEEKSVQKLMLVIDEDEEQNVLSFLPPVPGL